MRKIAVITTTRAEYGLLKPLIEELRKYESNELKIELIVSGTHLYEQYGMTVNEIDQRIDHMVSIPVCSETSNDISINQADTLVKFSTLFYKQGYDAIFLLGDRYETLAIAIAASNTLTPIFHMCGGDTTEGAMDEWIRHSISKMSYLHFVTNEQSRQRVIQMGENPERVFNYGSTSIDNVLRFADIERDMALNSIGLEECKFALCTYHPVTMEEESVDYLIREFVEAISSFSGIDFIVTKSNADCGGARINYLLDQAGESTPNIHVYASLGVRRYLSLMKYSEFVLGNSSSGIIEAPSFHVPTINVGDRQRGRLQAESIINCGIYADDIIKAISIATSDEFRSKCVNVRSPYGDGNAAKRIALKSIEVIKKGGIDLKKSFYDL